MRGGGIAAGQQRDGRDERLGQGGSYRGEDAADRSLGDMQSMAGPFDAVGKKFRAYEDDREAQGQDYRVDYQIMLGRGAEQCLEWSSVENRDAVGRFPARTGLSGTFILNSAQNVWRR